MQPDNNLNPFGLRKAAEAARRGPSHIKFLFLFVGTGIVMSFLVLASLAPQVGDKLGTLSVKKQIQESQAALKVKPQGPCLPYGDVNYDRLVNSTDSNQILQVVAGQIQFKSDPKYADLDLDGTVTSKDALLIQRYISGMISRFPACPRTSFPIPN